MPSSQPASKWRRIAELTAGIAFPPREGGQTSSASTIAAVGKRRRSRARIADFPTPGGPPRRTSRLTSGSARSLDAAASDVSLSGARRMHVRSADQRASQGKVVTSEVGDVGQRTLSSAGGDAASGPVLLPPFQKLHVEAHLAQRRDLVRDFGLHDTGMPAGEDVLLRDRAEDAVAERPSDDVNAGPDSRLRRVVPEERRGDRVLRELRG